MPSLVQGQTYTPTRRNHHFTVPCWEWVKQVTFIPMGGDSSVDDDDDDDDGPTPPYGYMPSFFITPTQKKTPKKPASGVEMKGKEFVLVVSPDTRLEFVFEGYNSSTEVILTCKRFSNLSQKLLDQFPCLMVKSSFLDLIS